MRDFFRKLTLSVLKLFKPYRSYALLPEREVNYNQLDSTTTVLYSCDHQPVNRTAPLTADVAIHPKFKDLLKELPSKTFVIKAKGWKVWGSQGAVITGKGYLFKDVSREFGNARSSVFDQLKLIAPKQIPGLTAVLAASGSSNYYHWMFDILPRIGILKKYEGLDTIDHFVLNYNGKTFQEQTLKRAGIDLSKIITCNDHWNFHIQADELLIPSLPSNNDSPSQEACLYLRELYKEELSSDGPQKKLYIKRPPGRCIVNEDELLDVLLPLGFEIIYPEQLTMEEQASAFSKAEIVVGIHGAGFANLVFCRPQTRVLDILSPEWINPCFWILSNNLGLKYACLIGEDSYKEKGVSGKGANILVNLPKFNRLLNELYA